MSEVTITGCGGERLKFWGGVKCAPPLGADREDWDRVDRVCGFPAKIEDSSATDEGCLNRGPPRGSSDLASASLRRDSFLHRRMFGYT